jgi:hypothetical protein
MDTENWLVGWREIGKYVGRSAKTAQRWAREGMPFCRDPGGRPMAKPSQIDKYILDLNRSNYDDKTWRDKGIDTALEYEGDKEKKKREFDEKLFLAQRPTRSMF